METNMPRRTANKGTTYQSVRKTATNAIDDLEYADAIGIAKLILGAVLSDMAVYCKKGRGGTLLVRIYDGDDKYEEVIGSEEDIEVACEEIL